MAFLATMQERRRGFESKLTEPQGIQYIISDAPIFFQSHQSLDPDSPARVDCEIATAQAERNNANQAEQQLQNRARAAKPFGLGDLVGEFASGVWKGGGGDMERSSGEPRQCPP